MKPLERYDMDEDGWEYPRSCGEWVRYSEALDEIEKLEKQNQMMLDALKGLYNGNWGCPCELSNEELAAWEKARAAITNVEGQQ